MKLLLPLLLLSVFTHAQVCLGFKDDHLPKRTWLISDFGIVPDKGPVGKAVQRIIDSAKSEDTITIITFDIPGNYCYEDVEPDEFGKHSIRTPPNVCIGFSDQKHPPYFPTKIKGESQWSWHGKSGYVCLGCCVSPKKAF
jgi:hypothetical protein